MKGKVTAVLQSGDSVVADQISFISKGHRGDRVFHLLGKGNELSNSTAGNEGTGDV